jgi:acyl carrier protein
MAVADSKLFSKVAAEVALSLRCDASSIVPATCAADIESWNSLNNVKLLIDLERRFKIRFTGIEAASLQNVGELADLIAAKLGS